MINNLAEFYWQYDDNEQDRWRAKSLLALSCKNHVWIPIYSSLNPIVEMYDRLIQFIEIERMSVIPFDIREKVLKYFSNLQFKCMQCNQESEIDFKLRLEEYFSVNEYLYQEWDEKHTILEPAQMKWMLKILRRIYGIWIVERYPVYDFWDHFRYYTKR